MQVVFTGHVYEWHGDFKFRNIPRTAGFRWDNLSKVWWTASPRVATKLENLFDATAKKAIQSQVISYKNWEEALDIVEGETLYGFQEEACYFALSRSRSYLALDPGLGKTPVAGVVLQTLSNYNPKPIGGIYICPPFLTRNTEAELNKWAPSLKVARQESNGVSKKPYNFLIIPDSILHREEAQERIFKFCELLNASDHLSVLIVDEAHRYKNDTAKRTQSLFEKIVPYFSKQIYLSGTPMPNRPIELFPLLSSVAPETIDYMNRFEYGKRYCDAHQNEFGWDFGGASNMGELVKNIMGKFMLRFKKSILPLPEKLEEMIIVSSDLPPRLERISQQIKDTVDINDLIKGIIKIDLGKDELALATYRKELGILKAPTAAEYINYCLEENEEESILVFAIHKEVISILSKALDRYAPLVVTGDTRMELRHEMVKQFQTDKKRRVFIGNIQAAGIGLTLTKSTRVVFAEFSWVPADNDQASDRAHRIGQTSTVSVQYLVHRNSIDKNVIETVLKKRKVTALV